MHNFSLKHGMYSLVFVLSVLFFVNLLAGLTRSDEEVTANTLEIPEFTKSVSSAETDSDDALAKLIQKYQTLSPKKLSKAELAAQREAELLARRSQPKPIDKTIKPFFAQLDEEHQIGLVGVFSEKQPFAVVHKIKFEDKSSSFHKLYKQSTLGKYKVVDISKEAINLSDGSRQISLKLFKKESQSV